MSHWDDKTGEVKTENTEETKAEDYGAAKKENAEQVEIAKEVFLEEDGAEDDMTEDEELMKQADPEKPLVHDFAVGDIASFELGNTISLRVTPGYVVNCWATPQYDEMPEFEAEICMEETEEGISFSIGDIKKAN